MLELTSRQAEYLAYIKEMLIEEQRTPTLRELGARFFTRSTTAVNDILKSLARKGAIQLPERARSRSIRVLEDRLHWQSHLPGYVFCPACMLVNSAEDQRFVVRLCADHNFEVHAISGLARPPG